MAYQLIRGGERFTIGNEPLVLEKGGFQLVFWQGYNDEHGPHGYEVTPDSLTAKRSKHPVNLGWNAGVDNMFTVGQENCTPEWKIDFAGEPLSVEWMT